MIGGNTSAQIQIKTTTTNEIGESIATWQTVNVIDGWLDLQSGDSKYGNYNAKIQESTHVFVADYTTLDKRVKNENSRVVIGENVYDVMLIDNPMELNKQLEIYLKMIGGQ